MTWLWFIPVYIVMGILTARWGNTGIDGHGNSYAPETRLVTFLNFLFWPVILPIVTVVSIVDALKRRRKNKSGPGPILRGYDFIMGRK